MLSEFELMNVRDGRGFPRVIFQYRYLEIKSFVNVVTGVTNDGFDQGCLLRLIDISISKTSFNRIQNTAIFFWTEVELEKIF